MPLITVTPTSDITITDWGNNNPASGPIYVTLAANTTNYCSMSGGTFSNALVVGTGFSTSGMVSVTAVTYSVSWFDIAKSLSTDFTITLVESGGSTQLATMTNVVTSSHTEITSTGSFAIQTAGNTLANWANFDIQLQCGVSTTNNTLGGFYGLSLGVTYSVPAGAQTVISSFNGVPLAFQGNCLTMAI